MTKISEVFDLQMGKTPSRKNLDYWIDGNTDWVSISDLGTYEKYVGKTKEKITQQAIDESGIKAVPKNTVLMSFKLSIGISAITREEKTYTNEAVMAFIDKGEKSLFPDYFYHQFRTKDWLENTSKAVMGSTLNKSKLSNCIIKVPDLDEQKHVANVLDTVCRLILIKKDLCKKLDDLVKSRFVEMFGDPVINSKGWKKEKLYNNAVLINGRAYKQSELLNEGKYRVLRVGNFFSKSDWYYSDLELNGEKYCENGDLLYAWSASFGPKIWRGEKVIYHYHIWKIDIMKDAYDKQFLCSLLKYAEPSFIGDVHGIGMFHLTKSGMEQTEFIVPPLSLQQEFASFVAQVDKLKFDLGICLFVLKEEFFRLIG